MDLPVSLVTTLACFILVLFVFAKNPRSATNIYFSLLIFFIGLYPIFNYLALHSTSSQDALFWAKFIIFSAVPVGPLFFLFVKTFPQVKTTVSMPIHLLLTVWVMINIILGFLGFIFSNVIIVNGQPDIQTGIAVPLFAMLQILTISSGSWVLFQKYRKATGFLKLQLRYIAFGIVTSFGLTLLSTLILPLVFGITLFIAVSPTFLLIAAVAIAYSILKHRLLDIRLVLARTVSFILLIAFFGIAYAVLFALLSTLFLGITIVAIKTIVVSAVLALSMTFSFQPIRKILEKLTDRFLYKNHYDTNKLLYELALIMSSTLRLEDLMHQILQKLLKQMKISRVALILTEKGYIYQVASEGFSKLPELDEDKIASLAAAKQTIILEELPENENYKEILRSLDLTVAKSLYSESNNIGLLVLGEKLSGDPYTPEDIKVLEIIAPEVAVAIQNATNYEEIRKFNITLQGKITQATQDLRVVNAKLQQLDQLKDDFVSIASHELRTPMTVIRSYAWMALNRSDIPLSDKLKRYLERMFLSTERLINLVNDMLNISRIESGKIEIVPRIFDIAALSSDVFLEVGLKAKEKNLNLKVEYAKIPKVFSDPDKVHQVLLNLVGNAVKFTPEGGLITVSFFSDGNTVETSIKDNGVGIAADEQQALFKKFGRLDNSYTAAAVSGGTGLGLYICKSLVELMGGRIWVKSEGVGKGATFTFLLPAATNQTLAHPEVYTKQVKGEVKLLEPVMP